MSEGKQANLLGPCHVGRIDSQRLSSENDKLLQRAVSHLYSALIKPEDEGGIKEWMQSNCEIFDDGPELKLVYTTVFKEYEGLMEEALQRFAVNEGLTVLQLYDRFSRGKQENDATEKNMEMLLKPTCFPFFLKIMRRTRRTIQKSGRRTPSRQAPELGMVEQYRNK